VTRRDWRVLVAGPAKSDFDTIVSWTLERFGSDQAAVYAETLTSALAALRSGPQTRGARRRDDIARGVFTLHVTRQGRRGRHLILFRVPRTDRRVLEVLRLLHDAMDLARHVSDEGDDRAS
jgi:toxin ParE1/3/4